MRLVLILFAVTAVARGQADPDAVLARAPTRFKALASRLVKYVCVETVNRSYYRRVVPRDAPVRTEAPSVCSASSGATGTRRELESTDRIRLEVTVSQS